MQIVLRNIPSILCNMTAATLPIINLSDPKRENTAKNLIKAIETVGCVYLDNVPGYNKEKEELLLKSAKWLFSLPLEEKLLLGTKRWNRDAKNVHRGYAPYDVSQKSYREWFEIGEELPEDDPDVLSGNPLYECNQWPNEEGAGALFRKTVTEYHRTMAETGKNILKILALGCGMDENAFVDILLQKPTSNLALTNYPYFASGLSLQAHTDTGICTLVGLFSYHGLEIQMKDGTWLDVEPRPGSLILLIGLVMTKITDGRFKGTVHRVKSVKGGRLSSIFFFEPSYNAEFPVPGEAKPFKYGPYCIQRYRTNYPELYSEMADFDTAQ